MTEKEVLLVKKSWQKFYDINPAIIADLFYSKLFFDHPKLRKLFPKNMDEQYKKLIAMLSSIVIHANDLSVVGSEIRAMALRHRQQYRVKPEHYAMVKDALLFTLEKGLGNEWNDAVKQAWVSCYSTVANMMIYDIEKDAKNT
jgi:nitric oxide dioxygenase